MFLHRKHHIACRENVTSVVAGSLATAGIFFVKDSGRHVACHP